MSRKKLNARLSEFDGMLTYNRKPHLVSVTLHLLTLAHLTHASYDVYLENKKTGRICSKRKKQRKNQVLQLEKKQRT